MLAETTIDPPIEITDPIEVFKYPALIHNADELKRVEQILIEAEIHAVSTAEATRYARETIVAAREYGMKIAIVSNNSAESIHRYLDIHRLNRHIDHVIGRPYANPKNMKPSPWPLHVAAKVLNVKNGDCAFVGDSITDIDASSKAKIAVFAFANKEGKEERFKKHEKKIKVIKSMRVLAHSFISLNEERKRERDKTEGFQRSS